MMPKLGQQKGTKQRRAEFIEYLRRLGDGSLCVYWPWSDNRVGYTSIHVDGRMVRAHRWVYEQVTGDVLPASRSRGPGETIVMHTCDNPPCVRPSHLRRGTPLDNTQDAIIKGRWKHRIANRVTTKLTLDQVADIRRWAKSGTPRSALASIYEVSVATIGDIVRGRSRVGSPHQKLTDGDVSTIRYLFHERGVRQVELARRYSVSDATISHILHGRKDRPSRYNDERE